MTQHWLSKHLGTRKAAAGLALILGRPLVQSGHLKRILFLSPTLEDCPIQQSPATSRSFYGSILSSARSGRITPVLHGATLRLTGLSGFCRSHSQDSTPGPRG